MALRQTLHVVPHLAAIAVIVAGGASLVREHVVEITPINGTSMSSTLSPDFHETGRRDWIVWKMWRPTQDLEVGDLVLFHNPVKPDGVVAKRLVALGGDRIVLDPKRRPGFGKNTDELTPEEVVALERWNSYGGSLRIPFGHLWFEGDNWRFTRDSNSYGPVSKSLVLGKALLAVWPLSIWWTKPWEGYKSATRRVVGDEIIPEVWRD